MKLDIPEQTAEQKAADVERHLDNLKSQSHDQVQREAIRATDTHVPIVWPAALQHITPEELQLIALFRRNDERGQKLVFRIVTIHAVEYPRGK